MNFATTDDGIRLHVEEVGEGSPIVFVHEFGGDHRSWEPQLRHFSRRHRCIAFAARGYPPSDVPDDPQAYSQERAVRDIACVMDHCGVDAAHVVGLSMGGFATLHFGLTFRSGPVRWSLPAPDTGGKGPAGHIPQEFGGSGRSVREAGRGGIRKDIRPGARTNSLPTQGPARTCGIHPHARRAFCSRLGPDHARGADAPPLAL
jgi:pimeloyl-ACP methyl ester carboxylesterase